MFQYISIILVFIIHILIIKYIKKSLFFKKKQSDKGYPQLAKSEQRTVAWLTATSKDARRERAESGNTICDGSNETSKSCRSRRAHKRGQASRKLCHCPLAALPKKNMPPECMPPSQTEAALSGQLLHK